MGLFQQIVISFLLIDFIGIKAQEAHNDTITKNLINALSQFVQGKDLVCKIIILYYYLVIINYTLQCDCLNYH